MRPSALRKATGTEPSSAFQPLSVVLKRLFALFQATEIFNDDERLRRALLAVNSRVRDAHPRSPALRIDHAQFDAASALARELSQRFGVFGHREIGKGFVSKLLLARAGELLERGVAFDEEALRIQKRDGESGMLEQRVEPFGDGLPTGLRFADLVETFDEENGGVELAVLAADAEPAQARAKAALIGAFAEQLQGERRRRAAPEFLGRVHGLAILVDEELAELAGEKLASIQIKKFFALGAGRHDVPLGVGAQHRIAGLAEQLLKRFVVIAKSFLGFVLAGRVLDQGHPAFGVAIAALQCGASHAAPANAAVLAAETSFVLHAVAARRDQIFASRLEGFQIVEVGEIRQSLSDDVGLLQVEPGAERGIGLGDGSVGAAQDHADRGVFKGRSEFLAGRLRFGFRRPASREVLQHNEHQTGVHSVHGDAGANESAVFSHVALLELVGAAAS